MICYCARCSVLGCPDVRQHTAYIQTKQTNIHIHIQKKNTRNIGQKLESLEVKLASLYFLYSASIHYGVE